MATITTINETDFASDSRTTINDNFTNLNTNKVEVDGTKVLSDVNFTTTYQEKLENLAPNYSLTEDLVDDIQTTLDDISTAGGGTLYLLPGTYVLSNNINIPSGVTLSGLSRDTVILDCSGGYTIRMNGSDEYSLGTVTINNGDTTLVGAGGATFVSSMVGQNVWLDGYWYEIATYTDGTHLELAEPYDGTNLSGASYIIASINQFSTIEKLSISGAVGTGLEIKYSREPNIYDILVYDCATGIDIDYCLFPQLFCSSFYNGINLDMNYVEGFKIDYSEFSFSTTGAGIVMTNTNNALCINTSITYNATNGVSATSCVKLPFIACDISGNINHGVELISGCNDNQLSNTVLNDNGVDGVKITATSDRNILNALTVNGNGSYGVNISNANCDSNVLIGVIATGNVTGTLSDSGTSTLKSTAVNVI